jgi:hypothetical protein
VAGGSLDEVGGFPEETGGIFVVRELILEGVSFDHADGTSAEIDLTGRRIIRRFSSLAMT